MKKTKTAFLGTFAACAFWLLAAAPLLKAGAPAQGYEVSYDWRAVGEKYAESVNESLTCYSRIGQDGLLNLRVLLYHSHLDNASAEDYTVADSLIALYYPTRQDFLTSTISEWLSLLNNPPSYRMVQEARADQGRFADDLLAQAPAADMAQAAAFGDDILLPVSNPKSIAPSTFIFGFTPFDTATATTTADVYPDTVLDLSVFHPPYEQRVAELARRGLHPKYRVIVNEMHPEQSFFVKMGGKRGKITASLPLYCRKPPLRAEKIRSF